SRYRRRRAFERGARDRRSFGLRRDRRSRARAERRARHERDGALGERIAGALYADDRGRGSAGLRAVLRARAVPVRGDRRAHGRARSHRSRLARRRRPGRDADGRAARPAAEDDAARAARTASDPGVGPRGRHARRRRAAGARVPGRRGQIVPDPYRRPHGRRHDVARPARRPVAGTGRRRRGHDVGLRGLRRRGDGDGRAHAGCDPCRPRVRAARDRRGRGAHRPGRRPAARRLAGDTGSGDVTGDGLDTERSVTAPVSLIVSAFAPVADVRRTLTPELRLDAGETCLLLVDLAGGRLRLGGSCLAQSFGVYGGEPADLDDPAKLRAFFDAQRALRAAGLVLAYHDRSDGGLFATLVEMAFASKAGLAIDVPDGSDEIAWLFAEEPGVVLQVRDEDLDAALAILAEHGLGRDARVVAKPTRDSDVVVRRGEAELYRAPRVELRKLWSELTFRIESLRDDPKCAEEAMAARLDDEDPGLNVHLTFDFAAPPEPARRVDRRPRVAVLREQGVNSQHE